MSFRHLALCLTPSYAKAQGKPVSLPLLPCHFAHAWEVWALAELRASPTTQKTSQSRSAILCIQVRELHTVNKGSALIFYSALPIQV